MENQMEQRLEFEMEAEGLTVIIETCGFGLKKTTSET